MHDGVYRMPGAPHTWKGSLLAAVRAASPPAAISHRSGGALYELPGGRRDLVELTCARWRRTKCAGLVVHERVRAHGRDITEVDGIPVVRAELVVLELAGLRPFPDYVERVVQAARRQRLITYESTREMFFRHARRGVRGVQVLRAVLDEWDPAQQPTESEMETLLLRALISNGIHAMPQYEIVDRTGTFVARVDFALPAQRIAIEYDSMQEHSDEFQLARDARRRNRIVAAGWRVLTARHRDLRTGARELIDAIAGTARSA
jgi:very-short-patch-repair endonuclease